MGTRSDVGRSRIDARVAQGVMKPVEASLERETQSTGNEHRQINDTSDKMPTIRRLRDGRTTDENGGGGDWKTGRFTQEAEREYFNKTNQKRIFVVGGRATSVLVQLLWKERIAEWKSESKQEGAKTTGSAPLPSLQ